MAEKVFESRDGAPHSKRDVGMKYEIMLFHALESSYFRSKSIEYR